MKNYNSEDIKKVLKMKGYLYFTDPLKLNIIGIRSNPGIVNSFDDIIMISYTNTDGTEIFLEYPMTTDPGRYYLENPINVDGTGILKEGQYINIYQYSLHHNEYMALCQRLGPVIVYRDPDRTDTENFGGKTESGMFGINIHHAGIGSTSVNKWSAGCQVFENINDFNVLMKLVQLSISKYGNKFTYTLINEIDFRSLQLPNPEPTGLDEIKTWGYMILLPLKDNIILKTENRPVKKTPAGIVYDEQFEKSDIR